MATTPSNEPEDRSTEPPAPEVLKPQADNESEASRTAEPSAASKTGKLRRRGAYRPSHKATFIGLAVVVAVLAANAGIIAFVLKAQQSKAKTEVSQGQVTISQAALDKLGVNRNPIGAAGIELSVNPNARFGGKVQVAGDVSIAGQLKLNSTFTTTAANVTRLQAGDTKLSQLNVNGDGSMSNLALRRDLTVAGATRLQGVVTVSQLFTVNSNMNVIGNLAVGGTLSVGTLHTTSLVLDSTLTIGGHVITRGLAPSVVAGPAVGSNGTVSISGNDASGTVAVNAGIGAGGGILANVTFRTPYTNIPHVVVTAVGPGANGVYVNRSPNGFSIGVNGSLSTAGHAFDYIVQQ